jgi:hypothetical protein
VHSFVQVAQRVASAQVPEGTQGAVAQLKQPSFPTVHVPSVPEAHWVAPPTVHSLLHPPQAVGLAHEGDGHDTGPTHARQPFASG